MEHLIAILVLAVVCVAWVFIQRASGRENAAACGSCGGGVCRKETEGACPNDSPQTSEPVQDLDTHSAAAPDPPGRSPIGLIVGALTLAGLATALATSTGLTQGSSEAGLTSRSTMLMGTQWTVTIAAPGGWTEAQAEEAISAAFSEVARVEEMMSEWRTASALSLVNAGAGSEAVPAPAELRAIIERGIAFGDASSGAFDITWLGMGDLWHFDDRPFEVPPSEAVAAAAANVDYRRIEIEGDRVRLDAAMAIGLGGIAKGYAVDRAVEQLIQAGIERFYIDGGGDVRVLASSGSRPWRVGVRDPRGGREAMLSVLELRDGAVVSSGDYERFREVDGVRYHHIIDPRTGYPAQGCQGVTVIAPSAETADALATAAFVLGPVEGMALIEATEGVEGVITDTEGTVLTSSGLE